MHPDARQSPQTAAAATLDMNEGYFARYAICGRECAQIRAGALEQQQQHPSTRKQASIARYGICGRGCAQMRAEALKLRHLHASTQQHVLLARYAIRSQLFTLTLTGSLKQQHLQPSTPRETYVICCSECAQMRAEALEQQQPQP